MVPAAVDVAASRIVQESLTNVIRHVGPTRVAIALEYDEDAVRVRIVDEGCGSATDQASNGTGRSTEPRRALRGDSDAGGGVEIPWL